MTDHYLKTTISRITSLVRTGNGKNKLVIVVLDNSTYDMKQYTHQQNPRTKNGCHLVNPYLLTIFLTRFAAKNILKKRRRPAAAEAASSKLTPVLK